MSRRQTFDPKPGSAPVVVMVGPVRPFRGGISQHTNYTALALEQICELHVLSYRRLFPKMLYPGASDTDPNSPDAGLKRLDYLLDSINPFSWFSVLRKIKRLKPDIVIIPWWTFFLGPCTGYIARGCRRAGIEVSFICHNADEHESGWWKARLARWVLGLGSQIFAQSGADKALLEVEHPTIPVHAFPHPIHAVFPDPDRELPRRAKVELLFFGLVRHYKGLDILLDSLNFLGDLDWHLSIVGEVWEDAAGIRKVVEDSGFADRIEFVDSYVSDIVAARYFARADLVVLPYRKPTGSGVIPLAYRYGKPVIATRIGGLTDLVDHGATGFLVEPENPKAVADAIRDWMEKGTDPRPHIESITARLSWDKLAEALVSARHIEGSQQASSGLAGLK